jgi:predicted metal-dependent peptidase
MAPHLKPGAQMSKDKTTAADTPFNHATEAEAALFNLQPHLVGMMLEEPFYAKVLRILTKTKTRSIPTAGVIAKDGELKMYWNDRFMAALEGKHVRGVMKHEMLHLIFEHTTTRKYEPHKIWNYATDLAINSHLMDELPDFGLFPGKAFKALSDEQRERMGEASVKQYEAVSAKLESFPKSKSAEWYFARLMEDDEVKDAIENPAAGKGGKSLADALRDGDVTIGEGGQVCDADGNPLPTVPGTLDDHDGWGEMSDDDREYVKAKIKQAAGDAARDCDSKGNWGNVPAELRKQIKACLVADVPWQKIIDRFCGYSRRANRTTSYSRIHSTLGRLVPGAKRGYTSSVATYIDQSGSVSDRELALCFGELKNLAKNTEFTCYHFDTEIDEKSKQVWKRAKTPNAHRTRGGGTCFKAPTAHAVKNRKNFDGYIILTDGYAADPGPSRIPRAWVITPDGAVQDWMNTYKKDIVVQMKWPKAMDVISQVS